MGAWPGTARAPCKHIQYYIEIFDPPNQPKKLQPVCAQTGQICADRSADRFADRPALSAERTDFRKHDGGHSAKNRVATPHKYVAVFWI